MSEFLVSIARALQRSAAQDVAVDWLRNVPGLPPIVQTIHILAIAAVMGSIMMLNLRALGLAFPSQRVAEMTERLMPWTWWSLPFLFVSGGIFILARPLRYFTNPVVGIKFGLLIPALILAFIFQRMLTLEPTLWDQPSSQRTLAKIIAAASLLLWIGIVLAGRWIAYSEYLFSPE
jgi:hypothetical protein